MKKTIQSVFLFSVFALPLAAVAQEAPRLGTEQLIAYGNERQLCGPDQTVANAEYKSETGNQVTFQCAAATGFVPLGLAGGLGGAGTAAAFGALGMAALASGSSGSSGSTNGTNGTQ